MPFDTSKFAHFVPDGATETFYDNSNAVVYRWDNPSSGKCSAMAFTSRSLKKWKFRWAFPNEERREDYISEWLKGLADRKEEQKNKRSASAGHMAKIEIGTIFYSSWGYDQTNVDFYQVIGLKGKKTVLLKELCQTREEEGNDMCGTCMPVKDKFFKDSIIEKRVNGYGRVSITSFMSASIWDGSPKEWTAYR